MHRLVRIPLLFTCALLTSVAASSTASADLQPFMQGTPMPQTASQMVAVTGQDGKVYLFGGFDPNAPGSATNLARVYDPALDTYSDLPSMPSAARGACGDVMPDGRIVIAGGYDNGHVALTQIYDPVANVWSTGAVVNSGWECAAATGDDGLLHLFGGEQSPTTHYAYDIVTDTWTAQPGLPNSRKGHGAASVNGKLYVFGGSNSLDTLDIYDIALNTWSAGATMPASNTQFAFTTVNGIIYVLGGSTSNGNDSAPYFDSVWRYDPALDTWTVEAAVLAQAVRESYAVVTNGTVRLFGGSAGSPVTTHQVSIGDSDGDGILDIDDNCPLDVNPGQEDGDADGLGDACDICPADPDNDIDADTVCGDIDNCPADENPGQEDGDADGLGDVCDPCPGDAANDMDGDGACESMDNCPGMANPDQQDADSDGAGDVCDTCPGDPADDADADGVCGDIDNCPDDSNSDQADIDGDGIGDICDPVDDRDSGGCCQTNHGTPTGGMWLLWLLTLGVLLRRRRGRQLGSRPSFSSR